MFLRQSFHGYDSLGAASYPDLLVAVLYFPFVASILSRAFRRGQFRKASAYVGSWHGVAVLLAIGAGEFRNHVWTIG